MKKCFLNHLRSPITSSTLCPFFFAIIHCFIIPELLPTGGKSYFLSFSYLEGRVYKPPVKKEKKRAAGDDETQSSSMMGSSFPGRPVKKQKKLTTEGTVKKAATDMNPKDDQGGEIDEDSKQAAKPKYMIPPPTGASTLLLTDLPEQVQVHILSFCDVSDLNSLMFVSKDMKKVSTSDKVWEQPLKMMLIEFFGNSLAFQRKNTTPGLGYYSPSAVCDPVTPLHERSDWRQSTSILRWVFEDREFSDDLKTRNFLWEDGSLSYLGKDYQARIVKEVIGKFLKEAYELGFSLKSHHTGRPLNARLAHKKKRLDLLFTDQSSLREYYLRLGKLVFLSKTDDLFEEKSVFCPCCVRGTMELPQEFKKFPKIQWPLVNLE